MRAIPFALASASLGAILAPMPVVAGSVPKTLTQDAGNACTLSIPTTDTGVRPKATGFRNEGSKNAFIICSVDVDSSGNDTKYIGLNMASFDGASHAVNCTGVARYADTLANIQYLTIPTLTTAADGSTTGISTLGAPPGVYDHQRPVLSVTCVLPPGVSILSVQRGHDDNDSFDGSVPPPLPLPQCGDGIDDDGDGVSDYPGDIECRSPYDNDESIL
jgi:hypothetical protein